MAPAHPSPRPDYDFEPFFEELAARNWFEDDPLLQALLRRHAANAPGEGSEPGAEGPPAAGESRQSGRTTMREWGEMASGRLRQLAEESARPENHPRLRTFDARGNRVDRVLLPSSTREALDVVEGKEGLGHVSGNPFVHYAKIYLYSQNGEGGVACSAACTDGLVRVLRAHGDRDVHRRVLDQVTGSTPGRVVHGAQFVTEIQGGSDVPANRTRAEPADGGAYRLYGQKWFCSNVNADHFLVTARPDGGVPEGSSPVGLFLVPARMPGGGAGGAPGLTGSRSSRYSKTESAIRNGHTIDRLKEKMGTRELATAEVTFRGARAWPVGPLERGLPLLLRHVLVPSRFGCVLFAAGASRRAERIAGAYAEFREAFGSRIADYPRVADSLARLRRGRRRALAACFRLLSLWEEARSDAAWEEADADPESRLTATADFRVALALCKAELTRRATRLLHEVVTLLGGNGIEESFSPLPRLYRDAVIMETWEGPYDVLLKQAMKDLKRFELDPGALAERFAGPDVGTTEKLADGLRRSLAGGGDGPDTVAFGDVARGLVSAFADRELSEVGAAPARDLPF